MRTRRTQRPAAAYATAGALLLTLPATAVAAGAAAASTGLRAHVTRHRIGLGSTTVLRGDAPSGDVGDRVVLEYEPAGADTWRWLDSGRVERSGAFVLRGRLTRSGTVRAFLPATQAGSNAPRGASGSPAALSSTPVHVAVGAVFDVAGRRIEVLEGHHLTVRGRLLPGVARRRVALLERHGRGWAVLARSRTTRSGVFALRAPVTATGVHALRVVFAGDRLNEAVSTRDGELLGLRYTVASWYEDGGETACGFHAYLGVANKTLPCGTQVTFVHDGRTVTATVDDRGPYVAGREFDLNQNTADALDMHGVETILTTG